MKFGNIYVDGGTFKDKNLGDDMQVLAIFNLYRHMGIAQEDVLRVPVSHLADYDGPDIILPINFIFWSMTQFSPKIHPVFLGLNILHPSVIESMELRKHEPIGCRDIYSYQILKKAGVDAYLGGCLTIALPRREPDPNQNKVFFIDIPDSLRAYIPAPLMENAVFDTQSFIGKEPAYAADEEYTKKRYAQYIREAKLMVTSRLHCALPCAAAGIPTILTCEKKSYRFDWLKNIMPIYVREQFSEIDWDPSPLEFEEQKKMLLDHAASRVWAEYHRLVSRPKIYSLYYNEVHDYSFEISRNVISFLQKNWDDNGEHRYFLWGVTQSAEFLYDYIQEHYPHAKLAGVIDLYHPQTFHGVKTGGLELLEDLETPVFVTPKSAYEEAQRFFDKQGRTEYVFCWLIT